MHLWHYIIAFNVCFLLLSLSLFKTDSTLTVFPRDPDTSLPAQNDRECSSRVDLDDHVRVNSLVAFLPLPFATPGLSQY